MAENGESSCALDFIAANFIALLEFLTWAHSRELMVFMERPLVNLTPPAPIIHSDRARCWTRNSSLCLNWEKHSAPFDIYEYTSAIILKSELSGIIFNELPVHLLLSMNHDGRS